MSHPHFLPSLQIAYAKMGKSIRSKGMRKNRALLRKGVFGEEEQNRLQRIITATTKTYKKSIFHDIVHPKAEGDLVAMDEESLKKPVIEEDKGELSMELDSVDRPPLSKKELDAIHLSRNQFKIKYKKYGKGKGRNKKK